MNDPDDLMEGLVRVVDADDPPPNLAEDIKRVNRDAELNRHLDAQAGGGW